MRVLLYLIIMILFLLTETQCSAQEKKMLKVEDYDRWYHFYQYVLSPNAKWVHYNIHNPRGQDTLVLYNIDKSIKSTFMGGKQAGFSPHSDWFSFVKKDQLFYQNLQSGQLDSVSKLDSYSFSKDGMYLIGQRKTEKELVFVRLVSQSIITVKEVISHVVSPDSTKIAYVKVKEDKHILNVIDLTKPIKTYEITDSKSVISGLTWNTKGDGLAFFQARGEADHHLIHYIIFSKINFPKEKSRYISTLLPIDYQVPISRLFFSQDDEQLFFDVKLPFKEEEPSNSVNIWSFDDKILPPLEDKRSRLLMCWHIKLNYFVNSTTNEQFIAIPTATGKNALVIANDNYLPHFKYGGRYVDLYIKDLITGSFKCIASKIANEKNHINLSPSGKYILWFKKLNWWMYDIKKKETRCLTCNINTHFEDLDYDRPGDKFPNDKPYWTNQDEYVLLSDYYDVWLFSPDQKIQKKITEGSIRNSKYRVYVHGLSRVLRDAFLFYTSQPLNVTNGIILKEINISSMEEGFSYFTKNKSLQTVLFTDDSVNSISKTGTTFMYTLSDFDKPLVLMIQKASDIQGKVIQQSNEHQKEYYWGKSELIHYAVNEVNAKAALFYPVNYKAHEKYPMIVYVYERMSFYLRDYFVPSISDSIGFNITHLTNLGYFVLLPDIKYTINYPGASAFNFVIAAVDKALHTASIDSDNIGLYGHSFGGFEVSYIATKTKRFKAIVSGAGWHDLLGTYLGTDDTQVSNMWRFDSQQLRITAPYFSKEFLNNSPILEVDKIETPILLWTGMEDYRVNWKNSVQMQMALWRLNKRSNLLLYPKEQHVLLNYKNQLDLNQKVVEWYNYYLKKETKAGWIK